jgi:hypothetical protein
MLERPGCERQQRPIVRFDRQALLEQGVGGGVALDRLLHDPGVGPQIKIVDRDAAWPLAARALDLGRLDRGLDQCRHPLGDTVLEVEDVTHLAIEVVGP